MRRAPILCRCGCDPAAHLHNREGTDCSTCDACDRYRPAYRFRWRLVDHSPDPAGF